MSESEFSTREIKMEEHERTTATSLGAGAERTAAEELGDYNGDSNNPHVVHPQQALALVSCGSYVSEWSEDDNRRKVTNKLCMPLESMNNVISIVYRDGCYTYFRASLLLRRIVDDNDKQRNTNIQIDTAEKIEKDIEDKIKKWLRIPDDEKYSDSGTAVFPVRFQHSKVGSVKVYAKLKESETIRKSIQASCKKIRTYGPVGVLFGCLAMYLSTWIIMLLAAFVGLFGYGLFRPLHRELELTIVPSNSWRDRIDELREGR